MSFLCLLAYIACTFVRPQDWWPALYAKPVVFTLSCMTVFFLLMERVGARKSGFAKVPQNFLMVGMFLAVLMSHVAHTYFAGLTKAWNEFIILFTLYFIIVNAINTERKFKIVVWFIVLLIVPLVFQGMFQVKHGYGWAGQEITYDYHRDEYRINWIGIFNDPNDLALLFVVCFGILLSFIFTKGNFLFRLVYMTMAGYLIYGIFLCNSRGGLLALMVTIYFFFIRRTNKVVLGSALGWVVGLWLFTIGPSRKALFNVDEASAYNRVDLWYQGILMMKANPLFGIGYKMFNEVMPLTAHNSYILAGSELGTFGLFFWMGLLYISFQGFAIVQKRGLPLKNYAFGLQCALVGFMVAAFFLSRTYIILPYLFFALAGAMIDISRKTDKEIVYEFGKYEAKMTLWWCVGVLASTYAVIKFTF